MQNPSSIGKSSTGMEANIAAAISYIWIVGLIFFIIEKESKFVRFHAMQSILYGVLWTVLMIVLMIVNVIIGIMVTAGAGAAGEAAGGIASLVVSLISLLIWLLVPLIAFLGLILAAVKAYQGQMFKLPIIGKIAENIVNK
ncbi:MAG: DUF4870 domain-containing protein [Pyrinomonadaceae bacterium]